MLLTKLAVPLAYNFFSLSGVTDCAFFTVMGPLSDVDFLGEGFSRYVYPAVLASVALLVVFRIYERISVCFGVKQYEFDLEHREEEMVKGIQAI